MDFSIWLKTEESRQVMDRFYNNQLQPVLTELEKLAVNAARFQLGFLDVFHRKQLHYLQSRYQEHSKNFLVLFYLYHSPLKLFADLKLDPKKDAEKIAEIMNDYRGTKHMVDPVFEQGFRLIELIDRQLTRYYQSADQRAAVFLSATAITASIVSLLIR